MELDIIEYELDKETEEKLNQTLKNLLSKTSADMVVLTDDAGRLIDIKGRVDKDYMGEFISSLISGIFGAAAEMSKMLSMDELDMLAFEGKSMDVLIKLIKPRFLVGISVKKSIALGSVRLFLREAASELEGVLSSVSKAPSKVIKIDVETLEKKLEQIIKG